MSKSNPVLSPNIFVVGAGPGIGAAIGLYFASRGFSVGLIARTQATLDSSTAQLVAHCPSTRFSAKRADVTDYNGLEGALDSLKAALGSPTVVVYNVASDAYATTGPLARKPLDELTAENLEGHLKLCVVGALCTAQWAVKNFEADDIIYKRAIFFTGGGSYRYPRYPTLEGLACGKAALRNLSLGLHDHYKKSGIHVATVHINGFVTRDDPILSPLRIAEGYWKIFEENENWTQEILYEQATPIPMEAGLAARLGGGH